MSVYLQFMIDSTGSMNIWIERLEKSLFEAIHMCKFSGFKKVSIVSYKDHDQKNPISDTGWCALEDKSCETFLQNLKDSGGGGYCECFKYAMNYVCDNLPQEYDKNVDKIYVIHITDSLPHNNDIDIDNMINSIDWSRIQSDLPRIDNKTYKSSKACKLDREGTKEKRLLKDNFIWSNIVKRCLENNMIINNVNTTLDYFGCNMVTMTNGFGYYNESFSDNILTDIVENWYGDGFGSFDNLRANFTHTIATVDDNVDQIFISINNIINCNIMLLVKNKIFGKLYRKLCKCRSHAMRQKTIDNMNSQAKKLPVKDKILYDRWTLDSYNNLEEIHKIIRNYEFDKVISYNKDNSAVINVKNASKLMTDMSIDSQRYITEIMSRLTIKDGLALNKSSVPCIPGIDLFSIIFHSVAPGTMITGEFNKATAALLARNSVICEEATKYLLSIKGTWLDFSLDKDINLYPMAFKVEYLKLLIKNKDVLTTTEYDIVKKLIYLSSYKPLKNMFVTIKYMIPKSMDNFYPDHMTKCSKCSHDRPISMIDEESICAYCHTDYVPTPLKDDKVFMVQCYTCDSFYARDCVVKVVGNNQCHACVSKMEPKFKQCSKCSYKFIMCKDMPYGTCKNCIMGNPIREPRFSEISDTFSTFFDSKLLLQIMGIEASNTKTLYNMYKTHKSVPSVQPTTQYYHRNQILNMSEIIEQVQTSIHTSIIERECCALCCDDNVILVPACGRKNCKQKLCNDCGNRWYGDNKKGMIVNLRHMSCMFCNREPIYKTMKKWGSDGIVQVQKLPEIDNNAYYAWCTKCNKISTYANRDCAAEAPVIANYICTDCETTPPDIKNCPKCEHPSILYSGCNHVTCCCGIHWCFECGQDHDDVHKSFDGSTIYSHMTAKHGGWYRNQAFGAGNNDDDDYYTDDDDDYY
jgi:hypothetical protein